jgi:hypothetical protein
MITLVHWDVGGPANPARSHSDVCPRCHTRPGFGWKLAVKEQNQLIQTEIYVLVFQLSLLGRLVRAILDNTISRYRVTPKRDLDISVCDCEHHLQVQTQRSTDGYTIRGKSSSISRSKTVLN